MSLTIRLLETFSESEFVIPVRSGVRLPLSGIAHRALGGESAESEFVIDDPGAGFTISDIAGFRGVRFEEDADLDASIIFAGNFTKRITQRGDSDRSSLITDSDRQWTVSVVDDNWQLRRRVIHNSDGIRPAETDVERMQWYIASAYSFNIEDDSLVDTTNPVAMDPFDYTGKFGIDVVNDCMKVSGKNCFIYPLQDGTGHHGIAYFQGDSTTYTCDLSLSNDPADFTSLDFDPTAMESWTTFPCATDAQQTLDPERLFSGGFMRWAGGTLYRQNADTAQTYGNRDFSVDEPLIKTADAASALMDRYLDATSFEESIVTVAAVVPAALVNSILAGQRISVKLRHLPGLETATWRRISQRGVSQWNNRRDLYQLTLELRDPRLIGGIGTGSIPVPAGGSNNQTPPPQPNVSPDFEFTMCNTFEEDGDRTARHSVGPLIPGVSYYVEVDQVGVSHNTAAFTQRFDCKNSGNSAIVYIDDPAQDDGSPPTPCGSHPAWIPGGTFTFTTDPTDPTDGFDFSAGTNDYTCLGSGGDDCYNVRVWAGATSNPNDAGTPVLAAGQPNARPEIVTMSGASGTTLHPFADGTLRVYVDNLDQTAAITSQDGTTGDFTLAFTPTSGEQVTVEYLGRGTG